MADCNEPDLSGSDGEEKEEFFNVEEPCQDLFSTKKFSTALECLSHMAETHKFDLKAFYIKQKMEIYDYIKFVNFVRSQKPDVKTVFEADNSLWQNDSYLTPVIENDPLLTLDIEESPDDIATECEEKDKLISSLREQMKKMRSRTQEIVESMEVGESSESPAIRSSEHRDVSYAESYAHFSIHHEMLSDSVRTLAYQNAFYKNQSYFKDKTVLDLGCGTGILSMFAAKSGCKKVTAVEMSNIIYQAIDIVNENGLKDKIKLVKGRLEDLKLEKNGFDVIVSEWMGYFLLYEGMIDSVISARDNFLKPDGIVMPDLYVIKLAGLSDIERYNENVEYWQDVYGFKMSCMRSPSLVEASVEVSKNDCIVTNHVPVHKINLNKCQKSDTEFTSDFDLKVEKDCELTAIVGYFDTTFTLPEVITFTTGPQGKPTHWKQTVFYLEEKKPVTKDQIVKCQIKVKRHRSDIRSLEIWLVLDGVKQHYTVQ